MKGTGAPSQNFTEKHFPSSTPSQTSYRYNEHSSDTLSVTLENSVYPLLAAACNVPPCNTHFLLTLTQELHGAVIIPSQPEPSALYTQQRPII